MGIYSSSVLRTRSVESVWLYPWVYVAFFFVGLSVLVSANLLVTPPRSALPAESELITPAQEETVRINKHTISFYRLNGNTDTLIVSDTGDIEFVEGAVRVPD